MKTIHPSSTANVCSYFNSQSNYFVKKFPNLNVFAISPDSRVAARVRQAANAPFCPWGLFCMTPATVELAELTH